MTSLGIDIGGSSVKVAVVERGRVLATGRSARYRSPDPDFLAAAITSVVSALGAPKALAVGLCAPGLVDTNGTVVAAVNMPSLVRANLFELVSRAVGGSTRTPTLATDARAAAHDIWIEEGCRGRLLGLSLGTGVGGSVLDDGVPLLVSGSTPGHLGQIDVTLDSASGPPTGADGAAGTLEAYIGLDALTKRHGASLELALESLEADSIELQALARALRIVHAIYRPQHIRLLGGVGISLRHTVPQLRTLTANKLTSLARLDWTLACGTSVFHAAQGAARLAEMDS